MGEQLDRPRVVPPKQTLGCCGNRRPYAGQGRQGHEQRMQEWRPQIVRVQLGHRGRFG
jgi:hypothetical protein